MVAIAFAGGLSWSRSQGPTARLRTVPGAFDTPMAAGPEQTFEELSRRWRTGP